MKIDIPLLKEKKSVWDIFTEKSNKIEISEPVSVIFPTRFIDIDIATVGEVVDVTGIVLVTNSKNEYVVFTLMNKLRFTPDTVESININGKDYTKLDFSPKNGFITSRDVIMDDDIVFTLFEEFYFKGGIPFYIDYETLPRLFIKSSVTTTAPLGNNPISQGLFTAVIAKDENGKQKRYLKPIDKFKWIPLNNPDNASNNNASRLLGSYQVRGRTAALADDNPLDTNFDKILAL